MGDFPRVRLRRLREQPSVRRLLQETRLSVSDFIYPMFVTHGRGVRREIESMPGIHQLSLDSLMPEIGEVADLGIRGCCCSEYRRLRTPWGARHTRPTASSRKPSA